MNKDPLLGGMALLEGVMMKAPHSIAMAVRKPDGKIFTKKWEYTSITQRHTWLNIPLVRGVIGMVEMLVIGFKALNVSADVQLEEEEGDKGMLSAFTAVVSLLISLTLAIVLFKFVPFGATAGLGLVLPQLQQSVLFSIVEGIIKAGIFLGYIWGISLIPDIFRVFQYHGAEHKAIRCVEENKKLTVANVKSCSRFHPRCGTSFMIFIILISIIIYAMVPLSVGFWAAMGYRLLLLPVIAGVSYEVLRFSAKRESSWLFRAISAPGVWTQKLTTKEPDAKQIAVGIKSLKLAQK